MLNMQSVCLACFPQKVSCLLNTRLLPCIMDSRQGICTDGIAEQLFYNSAGDYCSTMSLQSALHATSHEQGLCCDVGCIITDEECGSCSNIFRRAKPPKKCGILQFLLFPLVLHKGCSKFCGHNAYSITKAVGLNQEASRNSQLSEVTASAQPNRNRWPRIRTCFNIIIVRSSCYRVAVCDGMNHQYTCSSGGHLLPASEKTR